jgi:magnesium-transporting ATPase (P-type)
MPTSDVTESVSSTVAEILAKLETDPKNGLNAAQLQERLKKYGPNALADEKKSALSAFLAYFWGPIPWMIEAAALMALIVRDWGDFTIIAARNRRPFVASTVSQLRNPNQLGCTASMLSPSYVSATI